MPQNLSKEELDARRRAEEKAAKTKKGPSRDRQEKPSRDREQRKESTR